MERQEQYRSSRWEDMQECLFIICHVELLYYVEFVLSQYNKMAAMLYAACYCDLLWSAVLQEQEAYAYNQECMHSCYN